jgi:hypothetical protein
MNAASIIYMRTKSIYVIKYMYNSFSFERMRLERCYNVLTQLCYQYVTEGYL